MSEMCHGCVFYCIENNECADEAKLTEAWIHINVNELKRECKCLSDGPSSFPIEIDPECSELEECEEVGGGISPLQDIKVGLLLQHCHTVLLLRLQDTPQLNSQQDTQGAKWSLYG